MELSHHDIEALVAEIWHSVLGMDIGDAFGEIANMLGGSVKALVDGPCSLSLPTVIGGTQYTLTVPGSTVLNESWFASAGHPLAVRVLQRASADVPAFA